MEILRRVAAEQRQNMLSDEPITTPEDFTEQAQSVDAEKTFATSRSGTPAPYDNLEKIAANCADAEALLGIQPEDTILNLLAGEPHLSGYAAVVGAESLGATILTEHAGQYEHVIEAGLAESVSVIISIPSLGVTLADEIASEFGDPASIFPNLRLGLFGGEMLTSGLRTELEDTWGIDETREFYGSSETGLLAGATDRSRRLVPLLNHFIIELEGEDSIIDIRAVTEPVEGSILITDPDRAAVDLIRYRQGDRIRVYPDDPLPRIEVMGRADNAVNLAGALIHPGDIHEAVEEVFGPEVLGIPAIDDDSATDALTVLVIGAEEERTDSLIATLHDRHGALAHASAHSSSPLVSVVYADSIEQVTTVNADEVRSSQVLHGDKLIED